MSDVKYLGLTANELAVIATNLEHENAELRELVKNALINLSAWMGYGHPEWMVEKARELGIEVGE